MRGQVVDVRPTMKTTSGGSRERAEKDWQAKPAGPGSPSAAGAVITVTPVANVPSTRRNSPWSTGARSSSVTHRSSGRGSASTGCAAGALPADLRYRTAAAAAPACPITSLIEADGSSDRKGYGPVGVRYRAPIRIASVLGQFTDCRSDHGCYVTPWTSPGHLPHANPQQCCGTTATATSPVAAVMRPRPDARDRRRDRDGGRASEVCGDSVGAAQLGHVVPVAVRRLVALMEVDLLLGGQARDRRSPDRARHEARGRVGEGVFRFG